MIETALWCGVCFVLGWLFGRAQRHTSDDEAVLRVAARVGQEAMMRGRTGETG